MTKQLVKIPEDFLQALKADDYIYEFFLSFPPSHKREYVTWIEEAKRPETRSRRIYEAVKRIRDKHRLGHVDKS
jgi:uncharacterized protein YdeI (YjbR/CyaY-like superfamily)